MKAFLSALFSRAGLACVLVAGAVFYASLAFGAYRIEFPEKVPGEGRDSLVLTDDKGQCGAQHPDARVALYKYRPTVAAKPENGGKVVPGRYVVSEGMVIVLPVPVVRPDVSSEADWAMLE